MGAVAAETPRHITVGNQLLTEREGLLAVGVLPESTRKIALRNRAALYVGLGGLIVYRGLVDTCKANSPGY